MSNTRFSRSLVPLALLATVACQNTEFVTAPRENGSEACTSTACSAFPSLEVTTLKAPVAAAAQTARQSLKDQAFGAKLASGMEQAHAEMAAGKNDAARLTLVAVLKDLSQAFNNPAFVGDRPDLAMIRLNLEPLALKLGVR